LAGFFEYLFGAKARREAEEREFQRLEAEKREKVRLAQEERKRIEGQEKDRELERREHQVYDYNMRSLALTCRRCGEIAPPIPRTRNRYRCGGCGNQFAGAAHRM
jgi:hypothetical protein